MERIIINVLAKRGVFARLSNERDALGNPSCALGSSIWRRTPVGRPIQCITVTDHRESTPTGEVLALDEV